MSVRMVRTECPGLDDSRFRFYPLVECDYCRERIIRSSECIVCFSLETGETIHLHKKEQCERSTLSDRYPGRVDLSDWWWGVEMGMDEEDIERECEAWCEEEQEAQERTNEE